MRYALAAEGQTVNLEWELQVVRDYLALESLRLEERLRVRLAGAGARSAVPGVRAASARAAQAPGAGVRPRREHCWFVELADVPLFESEGNYARLHLLGKQPLLARSLSYLEERLEPEHFFRASRQLLVNLRRVEAVELGPGGKTGAASAGGREVEMSRLKEKTARR